MTKEKKYNLIVVVLASVFFLVYSYLVWKLWLPEWVVYKHVIFNWPDANANFYFARIFAEQGTLSVFEPLSQMTDNLLHTRSINVFAGNLVPITFLPAIALFGLVAKIFGVYGLLFLTPFLASLTVYLIYRLSFYIFNDLDLSLTIALLLLPLGPWLYFANIVMLPTILFIFLVVAGFLSLAISLKNNQWFWWVLSALLLSLAIVVRPTEIIWLGLVSLFVLYWNRQKINYQKIIICLLVFAGIVWLSLYLNKITYGSYLATGYFNLQSGTQPTEFSGQGSNYFKLFLAPFGFDLAKTFYNFGKYFVQLNWLPFVLAVFGFGFLVAKRLKEKKDTVWCKYHKINMLVFVLILIYYGSWDIADSLVKNLNTISISYVRYFLPLYILILPLAAYAINFASRKNKWVYMVIILAVGTFSWNLAFYSPHDGLMATKNNLNSYRLQYQQVSQLLEENAVIISDRSDKVFFPVYKVIAPQGDLPLWPRVSNIVDSNPVYYFGNLTDQELEDYRTEAGLSGIMIIDPIEVENNFKLYKIIRLNR